MHRLERVAFMYLKSKGIKLVVFALVALFLLVGLCTAVFLLRGVASSVEQGAPPPKLIQVEGINVTVTDIQSRGDSFTITSIAMERGSPVYSMGDGVASICEGSVSVRYNLKQPVNILIGMGEDDFTPNITDGQQVKSGDLIGWVSQNLLCLERVQGDTRLMFSCTDGGANDPRLYIDGLQKDDTVGIDA